VLVRLEPEEYSALKDFAAVTDQSMNEVVRKAIRSYLSDETRVVELTEISESLPRRLRQLPGS
jgi:hypothetical protein